MNGQPGTGTAPSDELVCRRIAKRPECCHELHAFDHVCLSRGVRADKNRQPVQTVERKHFVTAKIPELYAFETKRHATRPYAMRTGMTR